MEKRSLAKCKDFDFGIGSGCPVLHGTFEYEGGGCRGLGYMVDAAFLMRFLAVFGVINLRDVNGKSCWVTNTHDSIQKIEPLHKRDGTPFVISEWQEWINKQGHNCSAHELLTGEKP